MIRPAKNIVLCTRAQKDTTKSGLDVGNSEKVKPERGIILAIGEAGEDGYPLTMKVGDEIVYQNYTGNKVQIGEKTYLFIEFRHIVGVVDKEWL